MMPFTVCFFPIYSNYFRSRSSVVDSFLVSFMSKMLVQPLVRLFRGLFD